MEWVFFWIIFFIIGGIGLIMTGMLGMKGSPFRFLFAIFLILLAFKLLIDTSPKNSDRSHFWDVSPENTIHIDPSSGRETDIIFRSGVLIPSLSTDSLSEQEIPINTIFGVSELRIPDSLNVDIYVDAVFSSCNFPDGHSIHFGDEQYHHQGNPGSNRRLTIRADVIFGSLNIRITP